MVAPVADSRQPALRGLMLARPLARACAAMDLLAVSKNDENTADPL